MDDGRLISRENQSRLRGSDWIHIVLTGICFELRGTSLFDINRMQSKFDRTLSGLVGLRRNPGARIVWYAMTCINER